MRYQLKELRRNVELVFANSQEYDKVKNNYLLGGIMNCIRGNITNLYGSSKIVISKLGNWMVIELSNENKTNLYITVYRILQSLT